MLGGGQPDTQRSSRGAANPARGRERDCGRPDLWYRNSPTDHDAAAL